MAYSQKYAVITKSITTVRIHDYCYINLFVVKINEKFVCKTDALKRERFYKSGQGKKLKTRGVASAKG